MQTEVGGETAVCQSWRYMLLKILKKNKKGQEALTELEKDWDLPPELADKLEELICLLYSNNTVTTKDNELRYQLFCSRRGEIENHQILL